MSDNLRRYRAIRDALKSLYPRESQGNLARHLHTLAAMISGIVGSRRTNLPEMASKVPDGTRLTSREKKYSRWLKNARIETDLYFLPYVDTLVKSLAHLPIVLIMDGSEVGRGCLTLMVSLVYRGRALPLAWTVVEGKKGHFPEDAHIALIEQVYPLIPEDSTVIFLGDGEFDGVGLQATLQDWCWKYVNRTAQNVQLCADDDTFTPEDLGVERGERLDVSDVLFTQDAYGPVLVIATWDEQYEEPLYLVSNMELVDEACYWYRKRYRIETFFSDQKSRGFHLNKSHLDDPDRISRLMIAACLAYIWIIFLGALAILEGWSSVIHRSDRCDWSLFRLGLALLDHFLNEHLPIPVSFSLLEPQSVR